MWQVRGQVLLTNLDPTGLGGKKRERERKREKEGERKRVYRENFYIFSRFPSDRSVKSLRDKRQS